MGRVGNAAGLESTSLFEGSSSEYDMDSSCPPKVPTCVSGQACSDNTVHRGGCWRPARPGDLGEVRVASKLDRHDFTHHDAEI
jgi:hypothetical protein